MNFGEPGWLMALWVLPILAIGVTLALRSRFKALALLGPLIGSKVGSNSRSKAKRRLFLLTASYVLCVAALAQPRWDYRWTELKQEGTSIVVVLDTSLSMDAEDVSPSRMERAHREIQDLAAMLQGDRVGLVLFSGGAYTRMPLTLDYMALRNMVRQSNTGTLKSQGSDLGAAIRMATRVAGAGGEADRAMIVISDGEDQVGNALLAAEEAKAAGVHIFVVGVGTDEGAPIPVAGGGFKKDAKGELVLSRIEEQTLQSVAQIGGGAYVRSVAGLADMQALYQGEILGKLKRAEQISRREKVWIERFQWPLGVGWFLALVAFVVRGRVGLATVLLCGMLGAQSAHADDDLVRSLMAQQVDNPDDLDIAERLGAALFQAGQYNEAESVLRTVADRSKQSVRRSRSRYNAGLSAYKSGRLSQALESWQRVLQDNPDHPSAQKNAAAVQAEIQKRMGEEPPPQDGDGESSESDDQNQDQQEPSGADSGKPENDGTREPQPKSPEEQDTGGEGDQAQPEESAESGGDTGRAEPTPVEVKEISEAEAQRMFDAVREGDPRVVIDPGSKGGKDW